MSMPTRRVYSRKSRGGVPCLSGGQITLDRLIYYIKRGRKADKPETVRRWFVSLARNLESESPHPQATEALEEVIRIAPHVLQSKRRP